MARRSRSAVEVVPTADWPRVILALVTASREFTDELEKLADERLQRATEEAKTRLLTMPTKGTSRRNARAIIAQHLDYTTDRLGQGFSGRELYARAEVSGLPEGYGALPRAFDRRRFRHPVYGNVQVWVNQRGRPWFARIMYTHAREFERDISTLMDNTVRGISASG